MAAMLVPLTIEVNEVLFESSTNMAAMTSRARHLQVNITVKVQKQDSGDF